MAERKYYWIKLKRDFFKRHDIRIVEGMPNGKDYILFYLKLLLESVDHEGELRFSDTIPYNENMLSVITDTNIDIVKAAMNIFIELDMIEILDDGTIYMMEIQKIMGCETASAQRVRNHRDRKALQCNSDVTKCNTEIEIEKDIESEKESVEQTVPAELPAAPPAKKQSRFIPPAIEEIKAYCREMNYVIDAERFIDYYKSNGWKVGKNKMEDWKATVRNWARQEKQDVSGNASFDISELEAEANKKYKKRGTK